jgi:hypothetical protein
VTWSLVVETLDRHDIPDSLPFIVDDDGSLAGCDRLNTYLLTAWRQSAYDVDSLRTFHAYHLARLLRFVRARRCGECVDLTTTTTQDLTAYRDARQQGVQYTTLATEFGCFSSFFFYATQVGWIERDPIPRWGRNYRLLDRLPGLRLDHPNAPRGLVFRKPPTLHVRWTVLPRPPI